MYYRVFCMKHGVSSLASHCHWLATLHMLTASDSTTLMLQQLHSTQDKLNRHCYTGWM